MRADERGLGLVGLLELGPPAGGVVAEAGVLAGERGQPVLPARPLAPGQLQRRPDGAELAPHRRRLGRRGRLARGRLLLERGPLHRELLLGRGQLLGLGQERGRGRLDLDQLAGQPGRVGLGRGDEAGIHGGGPLPLGRPAPFGQQRRQAAGPFAERFVAGDRVAELAGIGGRQLRLGGHHRGIEPAELRPGRAFFGRQRGPIGRALLEPGAEPGQLPPRKVQAERGQLGDQVAVPTGGVGLALQRAQLAAHLAEQVGEPEQVALGRVQPTLGLLLPLAELEDAGRLLDDQPPVLGAGVENGVELALADDHVLLTPDAGVREHVLDVEQAAGHAVDRVLAVTAPEKGAGDGHLGELDREEPGRVVDGEADLGPAERGPLRRAGEDDVVHLLRPDRARRLRTEHPRHRIDHVGLAAAVRADDDGDARFHLERGGVGEGLEALERQRLQEHAGPR